MCVPHYLFLWRTLTSPVTCSKDLKVLGLEGIIHLWPKHTGLPSPSWADTKILTMPWRGLCLASTVITSMCYLISLHIGSKDKTQFITLTRKRFTHWALSSVPIEVFMELSRTDPGCLLSEITGKVRVGPAWVGGYHQKWVHLSRHSKAGSGLHKLSRTFRIHRGQSLCKLYI